MSFRTCTSGRSVPESMRSLFPSLPMSQEARMNTEGDCRRIWALSTFPSRCRNVRISGAGLTRLRRRRIRRLEKIWRYWLVTPPNARLFKETVQRFELARKHATVGLFLTISALVVSSPVCVDSFLTFSSRQVRSAPPSTGPNAGGMRLHQAVRGPLYGSWKFRTGSSRHHSE